VAPFFFVFNLHLGPCIISFSAPAFFVGLWRAQLCPPFLVPFPRLGSGIISSKNTPDPFKTADFDPAAMENAFASNWEDDDEAPATDRAATDKARGAAPIQQRPEQTVRRESYLPSLSVLAERTLTHTHTLPDKTAR
jgi:hypothetical protein